MSSPEEDSYNDGARSQHSKKRRVQVHCNTCKRKKIQCDGGRMPGRRCSHCIMNGYECTYVETGQKRTPPQGYVENLEQRVQKMEKLLKRLCSDTDITKESIGDKIGKEGFTDERNDAGRGSMYEMQVPPNDDSSNSNMGVVPTPIVDDLDPSDDEAGSQYTLTEQLKSMEWHPGHIRFLGKSSSASFIQTVVDLKQEYATTKRLDADKPQCIELSYRRPQFWNPHPWFSLPEKRKPHGSFPEDDLIASLIDLYFERSNCYLPILHRPTFEQGIHDRLHYREEGFGSVVLLVCAVGSRFSDDPRIFLEGYDDTHSYGWKWFQQVQTINRSLLDPPRLYDLQIYCLTALFLLSTSAPQAQACWTIVGVGIRLAQDLGAHRRKAYSAIPTVEEELWKRAFWVLVTLDRLGSAGLGRPCAIQDEDFDLDFPVECDDEYWTNPDPALSFKQPPDKPSKVTYFNCSLRLNQIVSFALRTIYSINKSKALLGFVGPQWEQHIVAELDSALNKWIDSVPDHLRWDPNREDVVFFNQSAHLYASYYQLQITVHRPFIPSPRKPSLLTFPSLAICTNAARLCIQMLDVQFRRNGVTHSQNHMALFTSGIVLLLNIWGGKRSGTTADTEREMADVHKCMKMLEALETRWHTAGRLKDVLYELASVGDLPLPQASLTPSRKRERDSDNPMVYFPPTDEDAQALTDVRRTIAGPKRISENISNNAITSSSSRRPHSPPPPIQFPTAFTTPPISNLPLNSNELGRIPLHPDFNAASHVGDWYSLLNISDQNGPTHSDSQHEPTSTSGTAGMHALDDTYTPSIFDMQPSRMFGQMLPTPHPNQSMPLPDALEYMQDMQSISNAMADGITRNSTNSGMNSLTDSAAFDNDTLAMWSIAPTGFEWDDWNTYIANVGGISNAADITQQLGDNDQT